MTLSLLITINILAWPIIQMGLAWAGTKAPHTWFHPQTWFFQTFPFERTGKCYEWIFLVRFWKDWLPDGAGWFKGGFPKRNLAKADPAYLQRFIVETCRGETVHWLAFSAAGIFFLWNEAWVGWIMVGYGFLSNTPCIVVQRYNRARLRRIVKKQTRPSPEETHAG